MCIFCRLMLMLLHSCPGKPSESSGKRHQPSMSQLPGTIVCSSPTSWRPAIVSASSSEAPTFGGWNCPGFWSCFLRVVFFREPRGMSRKHHRNSMLYYVHVCSILCGCNHAVANIVMFPVKMGLNTRKSGIWTG